MIVTMPTGKYYKIEDAQRLPAFFINVAGASDVWMYLSSNGAPAAGRQNMGASIFPYETDDRLHLATSTGPKTVIRVGGHTWEPFNTGFDNPYDFQRNLYKRVTGDALIFEEINRDWGLVFSYRWETSEKYGLIRTAEIKNISGDTVNAEVLDGVENIIPHGIDPHMAQSSSCLTDAYKAAERPDNDRLAIFYLTSMIADTPEPIEVLQANIAWHIGEAEAYLLSSRQINIFAAGEVVEDEAHSFGRKCAFMTCRTLSLSPKAEESWLYVFDACLNQRDVVALLDEVTQTPVDTLRTRVEQDIKRGTEELVRIVAAADGLQHTADDLGCVRHYMNVLYNNMRGGVFLEGYALDLDLFTDFLNIRNKSVAQNRRDFIDALRAGNVRDVLTLHNRAFADGDPDLIRLAMEFLPLTFSRRHGDPSRPWNYFHIRVKDDDGNRLYHYEGNWRDIFQNWEAMGLSFPGYIAPMIAKFLNASTVDGFNPYRINHEGIDWEHPAPHDPWSGTGYWGDHQIVYLNKLLEWLVAYAPRTLAKLTEKDIFTYADIPYEIVPYERLLVNAKHTIAFNHERNAHIMARAGEMGTDGKLHMRDRNIYYVSFTEKLLVPILAKLSNLVIGGGIWMNTQRPEWNDANNAIVGNGLSMVTVYQLYRHLDCCLQLAKSLGKQTIAMNLDEQATAKGLDEQAIANGLSEKTITLSAEVKAWFAEINAALAGRAGLSPRAFLDKTGQAFSKYRTQVYTHGFSGKDTLDISELISFYETARAALAETIDANKRPDGMYHAYNILTLTDNGLKVSPMFLMLEGQTAVLGSGRLGAPEALTLAEAMEKSGLMNPHLGQFFLYPIKTLKTFIERNIIPADMAEKSALFTRLLTENHEGFIMRDKTGQIRFHHNIRQSSDVENQLAALNASDTESAYIREIYEHVFAHKQFTGRSGIMYKYEGIGCIFWHQNSKFMVSLQEVFTQAAQKGEDVRALKSAYYRLYDGFGFRKTPAQWGAFPLEPCSHTPHLMPAQQPGMTGQVKEEILTRKAELGIMARDGIIYFDPALLKQSEFLSEPAIFEYVDVKGQPAQLALPAGSLAFTICQVPVVYRLAEKNSVTIYIGGQASYQSDSLTLDAPNSQALFDRSGCISHVEVTFSPTNIAVDPVIY